MAKIPEEIYEVCSNPCDFYKDALLRIERLEAILEANEIPPDELTDVCGNCGKYFHDGQSYYTARDGWRYHMDGCYEEMLRTYREDLPELIKKVKQEVIERVGETKKITVIFHGYDEEHDEVCIRVSVKYGDWTNHYKRYFPRVPKGDNE